MSVGLADLQDLAIAHDADAVGQHHRLFEVVRHMHEGDAEAAVQALQLRLQHLLQLDVERRQRLVEQQQLGRRDHRARQRHALLLAARQLARKARRDIPASAA